MKSNRIIWVALLSVLLAVSLTACGGGGGGSSSGTTTAGIPSAPTSVTATAGNGQVTISWTAVTGATSYNIYYSTTSGVTKTTGTKITGATSPYSHTGLTNGTTYRYIVTAVNSSGESVESAQVSAMPAVPTGGSVWPSDGIVFIRDQTDLWVMNTDGSNPRELSPSEYYIYSPSSSPDGSKVVFLQYSKGIVVLGNTGGKIIMSYNLEPSDQVNYVTWSYDGKIYFTAENNQGNFIYSVNADGTGEVSVSPPFNDPDFGAVDPQDYHPSISPDGSALLFSTNRQPGGGAIAKMNIGSGLITYLTYTDPLGAMGGVIWDASYPTWSPDGSKIVFQKDYPSFFNPTEIWIVNADGSGAKALTDRNVSSDTEPSFIKKPF